MVTLESCGIIEILMTFSQAEDIWLLATLIKLYNMVECCKSRRNQLRVFPPLPHTAVQQNAMHNSAVQCSAVHCSGISRSWDQSKRWFLFTALRCIGLHCTTLQCNALHCIVLHFTVLHCTALYCTALHYSLHYWTWLQCTCLQYPAAWGKPDSCLEWQVLGGNLCKPGVGPLDFTTFYFTAL